LSKGWFGTVPGVRNRIVDGLERYLVYGMRLWMVLEWCPQYRMGCG
jgi:hypothetical protein